MFSAVEKMKMRQADDRNTSHILAIKWRDFHKQLSLVRITSYQIDEDFLCQSEFLHITL